MKPKGEPLKASEFARLATITDADIKLAAKTAHPSLKPFLDASSALPRIKKDAV